jgi:hypothetical protein
VHNARQENRRGKQAYKIRPTVLGSVLDHDERQNAA